MGTTGTDLIDTETLRFNRYGFAQASKVNEQILNAEAAKNGAVLPNNTGSNEDVDESRSSSSRTGGGGQVVVTNLKDYLQNSDVEEFAENLPITVRRETKFYQNVFFLEFWTFFLR